MTPSSYVSEPGVLPVRIDTFRALRRRFRQGGLYEQAEPSLPDLLSRLSTPDR